MARVGSARDGWNEAAQELGGAGVTRWVKTRRDRGSGRVEVTAAGVRVTVENKVEHARFALPAGALEATLRAAEEKAVGRLRAEVLRR